MYPLNLFKKYFIQIVQTKINMTNSKIFII